MSARWAAIPAKSSEKRDAVLIAGFPAGSFAANCYLIAAGRGEPCLIVDPGQDAEPELTELLRKHRLQPAAVLLTHGHVDHIWSVAPVCGARDIPAYIHPDDRALLTDPARGLALGPGQQLFRGITVTGPDHVRQQTSGVELDLDGGLALGPAQPPCRGITFTDPDDVRELTSGMELDLAGVRVVVDHAPGHTPGSVAFRLPAADAPGTLFSGDLLFGGSIGRTDLP